jgi:hypothetical protein
MKEREYKTNISSRVGRVRPDYKQKRLDTHFHENVEENDNEGHHITASDLWITSVRGEVTESRKHDIKFKLVTSD